MPTPTRTELFVQVKLAPQARRRAAAWLRAAGLLGVFPELSDIVVGFAGLRCYQPLPTWHAPMFCPDSAEQVLTVQARVYNLPLAAVALPDDAAEDHLRSRSRLWTGIAPIVGRLAVCNNYPMRIASCFNFDTDTNDPHSSPADVFRHMLRVLKFDLTDPEAVAFSAGYSLCDRPREVFGNEGGSPMVITDARMAPVGRGPSVVAPMLTDRDAVQVGFALLYHVPASLWPVDVLGVCCAAPVADAMGQLWARAATCFGTGSGGRLPEAVLSPGWLGAVLTAADRKGTGQGPPKPRKRRCCWLSWCGL